MVYGSFDDASREYVICRPDTPSPWINYLGNEDFFTLISNTSGGYSFYKDARLMRLTRYRYNNAPRDLGGQYFYIKEGETVWNPGWMPTRTPLDRYECRHGLGYTIIQGVKNGLVARQTSLVPLGHNALVTRLEIVNQSDSAKSFDLFSSVEFCLWNALDDATNFQRNYSTGEVEVEGSAIYHKTEYRERRNHYALYSVNQPINAFDTDREAFLGPYNGYDAPEKVFAGHLGNSIASGWSPVGCHQLAINLTPGEMKGFIFILAYCQNAPADKFTAPGVINKAPARAVQEAFATDTQFEESLAALRSYWDQLLSIYQVSSGEETLDRMVNVWNQYQCMVTFNMSRSASYYESGIGRGMGFRDSTQDLLGFVHLIPERARQRILDIAATQMADGSAYHQYQPLTKRGNSEVGSGFNDDPLWLIFGVAAYVKETGDTSILDEMVPFDNDPEQAEPLYEHLRRSFRYTLANLGPHGLPLIGRADWNDCLNLNCFSNKPGESFQTTANYESGVAESVFIAGMFVGVCDDYAALMSRCGQAVEAGEVPKLKEQMRRRVLKSGWDGEWFLRAFDAHGKKVGSHECGEGQIFIEPQGFCVMAGIGIEEGLAKKALDAVWQRLMSVHGIALLTPPYSRYYPHLGEISSYPPGYKENGGIFCHNNPWVAIAETELGHGGRAYEIYRRISPAHIEDQSLHLTEPYVYSQMIAGPFAPRFGQAKNSWLTGTAAWCFHAITQSILGVKPRYDGLLIDPCLPAFLRVMHITRRFRGNTYLIDIQNHAGDEKGKLSLTLEGKKMAGNVLPLTGETGKVYRVEAVLTKTGG